MDKKSEGREGNKAQREGNAAQRGEMQASTVRNPDPRVMMKCIIIGLVIEVTLDSLASICKP